MNIKSLINPLKKPTPTQMAHDELIESQRQLLQHQSAFEYHEQMVAYYTKKVLRLTQALGK